MNLLEINLYLFWGSKASFGTLWQWNCYFLVSGRRENVQFHYNKWLSRWKARVGSFRTKSLGLGQKWNLWSDLQWFPHWTHLFGAFGRLPPTHPSTMTWNDSAWLWKPGSSFWYTAWILRFRRSSGCTAHVLEFPCFCLREYGGVPSTKTWIGLHGCESPGEVIWNSAWIWGSGGVVVALVLDVHAWFQGKQWFFVGKKANFVGVKFSKLLRFVFARQQKGGCLEFGTSKVTRWAWSSWNAVLDWR